jgi:hypothetical protein
LVNPTRILGRGETGRMGGDRGRQLWWADWRDRGDSGQTGNGPAGVRRGVAPGAGRGHERGPDDDLVLAPRSLGDGAGGRTRVTPHRPA